MYRRGHGVTIKVRTCYSPVCTKREIGHACNGRAYERGQQGAINSRGLLHARGERGEPDEEGGDDIGLEKRREKTKRRRHENVDGRDGFRRRGTEDTSVVRLMNSNI